MRICFAGTPEFAVSSLQLIHANFKVVAVWTQPDRPAGRGKRLQPSAVKEFSLAHDIPLHQPVSLRESAEVASLASYQPDVLVVAAYGLILPATILAVPKFGCINVHASLLPRWRGASPISHAILAGDAQTGVCIMQMDTGLDTGDILTMRICGIAKLDTTATLTVKLAKLGASAVVDVLRTLNDSGGIIDCKSQDANTTYAPKVIKADAKIDWQQSALQITRQIRAYMPWPIAWTIIQGQVLRIYAATHVDEQTSLSPGTIVDNMHNSIRVATGVGILQITKCQLPSRPVCEVAAILRGHANLFISHNKFVTQ